MAIQQAHHTAQGHQRRAARGAHAFRYLDKGALAVIGRGRAICEIRGLKLSGRLALATYLGVHLYYLGGEGKRMKVLIDWITHAVRRPREPGDQGELSSVERA